MVGLLAVIIGWRAKISSGGGTNGGRRLAITSLMLGLVGLLLSATHLVGTTGSFGTGGGKAGAIVGLTLGIIGMSLSGMALRPKAK